MTVNDILMLMGGLALFLYGMQQMSNGLEAMAADKMKAILEKFTSNRFMGVIVGAAITAIIQSSSATTVMVVGFVNSGLMTLNQAVWIIMGANIGTTITGQLIALDIGAIAPAIAFVGVMIIMFVKNKKVHHAGEIIAGLGVLFIGMNLMGESMSALQDSPQFVALLSNFDNPLLAIGAGAAFTAIIQSSSASIGILQALVGNHVLGFSSAVFVLFGQNIGTCITAVLASIGAKTNAKRTTIIHLMFNIFGTIVFTVLCLVTPLVGFIENLNPNNPIAQIANMHTLFNITTTILLLPLGNWMVRMAIKILPERNGGNDGEQKLQYIVPSDPRMYHQIGQVAVSISQIEKEVGRMLSFVRENVVQSYDLVLEYHSKKFEKIEEKEEYIDYINAKISDYIGQLVGMNMSEQDSLTVTGYYAITGNLERIGDHAMNIAGYAKHMKDKKLKLSEDANIDIEEMKNLSLKILSGLEVEHGVTESVILKNIAQLEEETDQMNRQFRKKQIARLKEQRCSAEASVLFSEMLTDFERIGDHALNIAENYQVM